MVLYDFYVFIYLSRLFFLVWDFYYLPITPTSRKPCASRLRLSRTANQLSVTSCRLLQTCSSCQAGRLTVLPRCFFVGHAVRHSSYFVSVCTIGSWSANKSCARISPNLFSLLTTVHSPVPGWSTRLVTTPVVFRLSVEHVRLRPTTYFVRAPLRLAGQRLFLMPAPLFTLPVRRRCAFRLPCVCRCAVCTLRH